MKIVHCTGRSVSALRSFRSLLHVHSHDPMCDQLVFTDLYEF